MWLSKHPVMSLVLVSALIVEKKNVILFFHYTFIYRVRIIATIF